MRVRTRGQFDAALACELVSVIYAEMNGALTAQAEALADAAHEAEKQLFVKVPRIWRDYVQKNEAARLERWRSSAADGFLISCLGHYHAVKDSGMRFALDHTGNVLNSRTYAFWKELGAVRIAVSPEMSREEINGLADRSRTEVLAYGYLPLMVTHQCPVGNFAGGKLDRMYCRARNHKEAYLLRSEKGSFPLETDCENCVCTVLSPEPLDIRQGMSGFDAETFRLDLTAESPAEVRTLLDAYVKALNRPAPGSGEHFGVYSKSVL